MNPVPPVSNISAIAWSNLLFDCKRIDWPNVSWAKQGKQSDIINEYRNYGLDDVVNLMSEAARLGFCPRSALPNSLGHIIANAPTAWLDPAKVNLLDELQFNMGAFLHEDGVDLDVIALCSGHGSNENTVLQGIKHVARQLVSGKPIKLPKKLQTDDMNVLFGLYAIDDAASLYAAVMSSGLARSPCMDDLLVKTVGALELPAL